MCNYYERRARKSFKKLTRTAAGVGNATPSLAQGVPARFSFLGGEWKKKDSL